MLVAREVLAPGCVGACHACMLWPGKHSRAEVLRTQLRTEKAGQCGPLSSSPKDTLTKRLGCRQRPAASSPLSRCTLAPPPPPPPLAPPSKQNTKADPCWSKPAALCPVCPVPCGAGLYPRTLEGFVLCTGAHMRSFGTQAAQTRTSGDRRSLRTRFGRYRSRLCCAVPVTLQGACFPGRSSSLASCPLVSKVASRR